MLDENILWNGKIVLKQLKRKLANSISLLYSAKPYLDEPYLKIICFSYIHPYLKYQTIAWASTPITKLEPLLYRQKWYVSYLMKAV